MQKKKKKEKERKNSRSGIQDEMQNLTVSKQHDFTEGDGGKS